VIEYSRNIAQAVPRDSAPGFRSLSFGAIGFDVGSRRTIRVQQSARFDGSQIVRPGVIAIEDAGPRLVASTQIGKIRRRKNKGSEVRRDHHSSASRSLRNWLAGPAGHDDLDRVERESAPARLAIARASGESGSPAIEKMDTESSERAPSPVKPTI